MNKMWVAYIGVLLLALHLSSQIVVAQSDMNATISSTTPPKPTTTVAPTEKSGSVRNDAFTLFLPLALAASLLHSWSQ
eukprot:superscaffoldBa00000369_g4158